MKSGVLPGRVALGIALLVSSFLPNTAAAQGDAVRRLATRVNLAVEEYRSSVDDHGRKISVQEYDEAQSFLSEARPDAERLPTELRAARIMFDSVVAAVDSLRPAADVQALEKRFRMSLGSAADLELPDARLSIAAGELIYQRACVSCHGVRGDGNGAQAAALNPKPPALGDAMAMADVSPATMFRKMSIGVRNTAMIGFETTLTSIERWNVVAYLLSLRAAPGSVATGEGLYAQSCVSCHGALGTGDGALSHRLSKAPPDVGSLAWQASRSDAEIARAMVNGVPGAPMPRAPNWTPAEMASVVGYVRGLAIRNAESAPVARAGDSSTADGASRRIVALLRRSLDSAKTGRLEQAYTLAFDAYAEFQPLETRARLLKPGAVSNMERKFADFRDRVRQPDIPAAEQLAGAIELGLPKIVELTHPARTGWEAFIESLLIIVREGFEAILVIGAVVAFLIKTGHRERLRSIWIGVGLGLAASIFTAVLLATILRSFTEFREIIEGVTMLVAVAVLFSVSYWLISKVEAAKWQQFIRDRVNEALQHGGGTALMGVAFLAVYREGAETALFYQALFNEGPLPIGLGVAAGGAILAVVFTLFYRYGVRIPLRPFFAVTSVLLYYMAFVFMGKGVAELQEGNLVSMTIIRGFPVIDALGIYNSWEGILAQLLLLVLFAFALIKTFWPKRSVALSTMPGPGAGPDLTGELGALRQENAQLARRLADVERRLER